MSEDMTERFMAPVHHELKVWREFFEDIRLERKNFEVRKNDRPAGFLPGDVLYLHEWDKVRNQYAGRTVKRLITYVLSGDAHPGFGIEKGYVVIGMKTLT